MEQLLVEISGFVLISNMFVIKEIAFKFMKEYLVFITTKLLKTNH